MDIRNYEPGSPAATPGAAAPDDADDMDRLQAVAAKAAEAMAAYAEKHNIALDGTTIKLTHNGAYKLTITIAKYIEQNQRDALERIAAANAKESSVRPAVQFIYEQSAG